MLGRRDFSQKGGEMKPIFLEDKEDETFWDFPNLQLCLWKILKNIGEQCCLMGKAWAKGKDL